MLSLEKCKALLNDPSMTDKEVEVLRSALYDSVKLSFDVYYNDGSKNPIGSLCDAANRDKV